MINELFTMGKENSSKNSILSKTAILTQVAKQRTKSFIEYLEANAGDEALKQKVKESVDSYTILDSLIQDVVNDTEIDELLGATPQEVKRMIKSQASAKSHSKKKAVETGGFGYYKVYVQAAIAEALLRKAYKVPRSASSFSGAVRTTITYTEEELTELENNQFALRAAIRNVQSKKSTEKRKEGFEDSERYKQILEAEQQLISIRKDVVGGANRNNAVKELYQDIDFSKLKKEELMDFIERVKEATN